MNITEFMKMMKKLSMAYSKDFDRETVEFWYSQLKDINKQVLDDAIEKTIQKNVKFPNIADIRNNCIETKKTNGMEIIELMKQDGYFKSPSEYDKILMWVNEGIIPDWFRKDMETYQRQSLGYNTPKQLEVA